MQLGWDSGCFTWCLCSRLLSGVGHGSRPQAELWLCTASRLGCCLNRGSQLGGWGVHVCVYM